MIRVPFMFVAAPLGAALLSAGCDGEAPDPHPTAAGRIAIADAESAIVSIVELDTGETIHTFEATTGARVVGSDDPSSPFVYLVERGVGRTRVIRSGLAAEDHGDHIDLVRSEPLVVGAPILGMLPTHVTPHHGTTAIFHDGDGSIVWFEELAFATGSAPRFATSGAAHHGVAVATDSVIVATIASEPDASGRRSPIGVSVRSVGAPDEVVDAFPLCPGLHGEAAIDDHFAFGCSDGVLLLEPSASGYDAVHLPNPADVTGRVGTLVAAPLLGRYVGNFGGNALALVDASGDAPLEVVPVPAGVLAFRIDADDRLIVLEADGRLVVRDPTSGAVLDALPLFDAFVPDGSHGPQPTFTLAGHEAFAIDPRRDGIVRVDLEALRLVGTIAYDGHPSSIAIASYAEHAGH